MAKVRASVRVFGRFLELDPNTSRLVSFFSEKKISDEASSNGWMSFFLLNFLANLPNSRYSSSQPTVLSDHALHYLRLPQRMEICKGILHDLATCCATPKEMIRLASWVYD